MTKSGGRSRPDLLEEKAGESRRGEAIRREVVIVHTNDLHSHFEQMPQIAGFIRHCRAVRGSGAVLAVDCGDHMDRMRMETEGSAGLANVAVLNETGYDCAILGNNEGLTFSMEQLKELYAHHAAFPLLGCNLLDAGSGSVPEWIRPSLIVKKSGLSIGIIGATIHYSEFYRLLGWDALEPLAAISLEVARLRTEVDVLVVLSHLGLNNDKQMAEHIPGIDCIIGGHTHHLLEEPLFIGRTAIAGAGKFGQYIGCLRIEYDDAAGAVSRITGGVYKADDSPADPAVSARWEQYRAEAADRLSRPAARLNEPLPISWERESPLGSLLADGLRRWTGARIGLVNAGQLLHGLPAGEISDGQLLSVCPSPINPCRMKLTGRQILLALEQSLCAEFYDREIRGYGFRGERLGTLCLAGLRVVYRPDGPPLGRITGAWLDAAAEDSPAASGAAAGIGSSGPAALPGVPLLPEEIYVVGTIDMFTFGIGYLSLKEGSGQSFYLPEFIRDVLKSQLSDPLELRQCREPRWIAETS